ncbi:MAG: hypothetical protein LBD41_04180 [Clostridiales Family XIII bacterium]|jgi:hypothetical protein|nr:hypothetical protein [Clostridiales Family XIII bacterium]
MKINANKKLIFLSVFFLIIAATFLALFIFEKNKTGNHNGSIFTVLGDVKNSYDFIKKPNRKLELKDILSYCNADKELREIYFIAKDRFAISISAKDIQNIALAYHKKTGYSLISKNLPRSANIKSIIEIIVVSKSPHSSQKVMETFDKIYNYDIESEKEINGKKHIVKQYKTEGNP